MPETIHRCFIQECQVRLSNYGQKFFMKVRFFSHSTMKEEARKVRICANCFAGIQYENMQEELKQRKILPNGRIQVPAKHRTVRVFYPEGCTIS